jgi:AAA domain
MPTTQTRLADCPAFRTDPLHQLEEPVAPATTEWFWHGYLARGNVTLLTSQWKAGKTTMVTGLLQQFATGGSFVGRTVVPAKALVISEEQRGTWADRVRRMPVGGHVQLMSRPFLRRPTPLQWNQLVDYAGERWLAGEMDVFVVDPLAKFLPGATESDMNILLEFLDPLQQLTKAGVCVLILHHPRKKPSEEGSSARGNGGLLAAVDIAIEMTQYGRLRTDERRRKLFALSRFPETPRHLVYEWDPKTGAFQGLGDPIGVRFKENWDQLRSILAKREKAATHNELLMDWPADRERPSPTQLYEWLNRASEEKRVRRQGAGRKDDPYRYRLPNEDDEYLDRGELPPIREQPRRFGS